MRYKSKVRRIPLQRCASTSEALEGYASDFVISQRVNNYVIPLLLTKLVLLCNNNYVRTLYVAPKSLLNIHNKYTCCKPLFN